MPRALRAELMQQVRQGRQGGRKREGWKGMTGEGRRRGWEGRKEGGREGKVGRAGKGRDGPKASETKAGAVRVKVRGWLVTFLD